MEKPALSKPAVIAETTAIVAVPTGTVLPFAGRNIPEGYLLCDGRNISRAEYSRLCDVIGETLPDLCSRFILGSGKGANLSEYRLGEKGGAEKHKLSTAEMPAHKHNDRRLGNLSGSEHGYPAQSGTIGLNEEFVTSSEGGDQPHNNMPPYFVLNYIIKY